MLWSHWKTNILILLIYSHSTCGISKEFVLKYDKNSYAYQSRYSMTVFGNTVSWNVLQYHAIIGCDEKSFFHVNGKMNLLKEALKKSSCLGLIECWGLWVTLILKVFRHLFKLLLTAELFMTLVLYNKNKHIKQSKN